MAISITMKCDFLARLYSVCTCADLVLDHYSLTVWFVPSEKYRNRLSNLKRMQLLAFDCMDECS